jgi:hypothetical protein
LVKGKKTTHTEIISFLYYFIFIENLQHSMTVDPLQTSTPNKSLSSSTSVDLPNAAQVVPSSAAVNDDRVDLLNCITDFSLSKLKKTVTNDRSAPKVK